MESLIIPISSLILSLSIIGSSYYISQTMVKENKRKNVASLKKYRIEILDKTLKQINEINQKGLQLLENVKKEQQNLTASTDIYIYLNQFLEYYNEVEKTGNRYKQDFSIWATDEQYNILNNIIKTSQQFYNELNIFINKNKNNAQSPEDSPPFFDDFVNDLSAFTNALTDELNNEIANF